MAWTSGFRLGIKTCRPVGACARKTRKKLPGASRFSCVEAFRKRDGRQADRECGAQKCLHAPARLKGLRCGGIEHGVPRPPRNASLSNRCVGKTPACAPSAASPVRGRFLQRSDAEFFRKCLDRLDGYGWAIVGVCAAPTGRVRDRAVRSAAWGGLNDRSSDRDADVDGPS